MAPWNDRRAEMFRKKFVLRAGAVGGWLIHWLRACSGAT